MPRMTFKENMARSKEVGLAFWRQGLHELGAALYSTGTVVQNPEYGGISTRTPGEVADGIRGKNNKEKDMTPAKDNTDPSQLQQHMEQLPEPEVVEPQAPEPDLDIERD